jgi:putative ABC transport system permease protein
MDGATGEDHEDVKYKVVGIFERSNSVLDNLILTSIESVWEVHAHKEEETSENHKDTNEKIVTNGFPQGGEDSEITAMLVKFKSPMAAITMPRIINQQTNMQAASPSFEIARLFSIMGVGVELLSGFAYLMVFIAVMSIFISLYHALKERRYDLAIMRSLGSAKHTLFLLVITEGVLISIMSGIVGLVLAHGVLECIGTFNEDAIKAGITGFIFLNEEIYVLVLTILVGIGTAFIPALQSYKTDITEVLAKG